MLAYEWSASAPNADYFGITDNETVAVERVESLLQGDAPRCDSGTVTKVVLRNSGPTSLTFLWIPVAVTLCTLTEHGNPRWTRTAYIQ